MVLFFPGEPMFFLSPLPLNVMARNHGYFLATGGKAKMEKYMNSFELTNKSLALQLKFVRRRTNVFRGTRFEHINYNFSSRSILEEMGFALFIGKNFSRRCFSFFQSVAGACPRSNAPGDAALSLVVRGSLATLVYVPSWLFQSRSRMVEGGR